jgi:hypothetical protein
MEGSMGFLSPGTPDPRSIARAKSGEKAQVIIRKNVEFGNLSKRPIPDGKQEEQDSPSNSSERPTKRPAHEGKRESEESWRPKQTNNPTGGGETPPIANNGPGTGNDKSSSKTSRDSNNAAGSSRSSKNSKKPTMNKGPKRTRSVQQQILFADSLHRTSQETVGALDALKEVISEQREKIEHLESEVRTPTTPELIPLSFSVTDYTPVAFTTKSYWKGQQWSPRATRAIVEFCIHVFMTRLSRTMIRFIKDVLASTRSGGRIKNLIQYGLAGLSPTLRTLLVSAVGHIGKWIAQASKVYSWNASLIGCILIGQILYYCVQHAAHICTSTPKRLQSAFPIVSHVVPCLKARYELSYLTPDPTPGFDGRSDVDASSKLLHPEKITQCWNYSQCFRFMSIKIPLGKTRQLQVHPEILSQILSGSHNRYGTEDSVVFEKMQHQAVLMFGVNYNRMNSLIFEDVKKDTALLAYAYWKKSKQRRQELDFPEPPVATPPR